MAEHERGAEIRRFITQNVQDHPTRIVSLAAKKFKITDRAVNLHVKKLVSDGVLMPSGNRRSRKYDLTVLRAWGKIYTIDSGLTEDVVWEEVRPTMGELSPNLLEIWNGGVTEMFNNVLEHSEGEIASVQVRRTALNIEVFIYDDGIGIFNKIRREKNLTDERHAILELSKGKLTTDPEHHSGIGIFFTSRMFDSFDIASQGLYFTHNFKNQFDALSQRDVHRSGTGIWMKITNDSSRTSKEIYDQYADPEKDDYGFQRTVVPVKLAKYSGDRLISRSQAKMVMAGLDKFTTVCLDFKDVPSVGQGFADEIFRVYAKAHPKMRLEYVDANEGVNGMIQMALSAGNQTIAEMKSS